MKTVIDEIPEDSLLLMEGCGIVFASISGHSVGDTICYLKGDLQKWGTFIGYDFYSGDYVIHFNNFWKGAFNNGYCRIGAFNVQKVLIRCECEVY